VSHFAEARILVVDDEPDVLEGYQNVFKEIIASPADEVAALAAELFGQAVLPPSGKTTVAAVDLCRQGEDAVRHIENKHREGSHYPVAFIDMRMPPGIDGLETAKRLRQLSSDLNIVVVTGYSDRPPRQIALDLGDTDRFFYLVKPFHPDELLQMTVTLINRWKSERNAADIMARTISELDLTHAALNESEATARQLKKQVDELRRQIATTAMFANDYPDCNVVDPLVPRKAPPPSELISSDTLSRAFHEGRAASNDSRGVALCPYSALTESEHFTAWIAGCRSHSDKD
jgi:CheY-like chemotaxis protein/ribosome modulation factor